MTTLCITMLLNTRLKLFTTVFEPIMAFLNEVFSFRVAPSQITHLSSIWFDFTSALGLIFNSFLPLETLAHNC